MMLNESALSYFLQKFDMEFASWTFYEWLDEETGNLELIYSSQKATKIFGRKVVVKWSKIGRCPQNGALTRITGRKVDIVPPKTTKKNGEWRHLNITILELDLTTQRARKVDMTAILNSNNARNARNIARYMAKDT